MNRHTQTVENDKRVKATAMDRLLITLFFCAETFSRSLLLAIIPLELLKHLGSTQRVTLFYAAVAIFGLGNSILVPMLLKRLGVRLIIAVAGVLTTLAAVLWSPKARPARHWVSWFAFSPAHASKFRCWPTSWTEFRVIASALSSRSGFSSKAAALRSRHGSAFNCTNILVMLGLALVALPTQQLDGKAIAAARHPITAVRRFFEQPRLRLAWFLAVIRSSFWVLFYIYAPIFSVACGWSPSAAAATLSLGTSTLFFVALWGRLVRIAGARPVLIAGYGSAAVGLLSTTIAACWTPAIAPILLVGAAFGASIIDGPGNIPFLRATRPHERPAMAGIYMTYRDVSQFAPVAIFSLILTVAELTTAFLTFAAVLFGAAWLSRLIHPRLR